MRRGRRNWRPRAVALLKEAGIVATVDPQRGRDHGCWNPLMLIYPQSGIPVVQLSLIDGGDGEAHLKLGRRWRRCARKAC